MLNNDWMGDLRRLAEQDESITVVHMPKTPRYWRAEVALSIIVEFGEAIGWRELTSKDSDYIRDSDQCFHVVVWTEHEDTGFLEQESGYYSVFRMGYFSYGVELIAEYAELFCFYDGKNSNRDDPKNPKLRSKAEAIQYMQVKHPDNEVI